MCFNDYVMAKCWDSLFQGLKFQISYSIYINSLTLASAWWLPSSYTSWLPRLILLFQAVFFSFTLAVEECTESEFKVSCVVLPRIWTFQCMWITGLSYWKIKGCSWFPFWSLQHERACWAVMLWGLEINAHVSLSPEIIDDLTNLVENTDDKLRNQTRHVKLVDKKSTSCGRKWLEHNPVIKWWETSLALRSCVQCAPPKDSFF